MATISAASLSTLVVIQPSWALPVLVAATAVVLAWVLADVIAPSQLALCGAAFTAPMNGLRVHPAVTFTDVCLVAAVAGLLLSGIGGVRTATPAWRILMLGLAVITVGGLLSCAAVSDAAGVSLLVRSTVSAGVTTAVVLAAATPEKLMGLTVTAFAVGGAAGTMAGELLGRGNDLVGRSYGLAVDSNHFGFASVLACAAGGAVALSRAPLPVRLVGGFAAAVALAGVMSSGSRAGAVGLGVVLAGTVWGLFRRGLAWTVGGVVAGVGVLATAIWLGGDNSAVARLLGSTESGQLTADLSDQSREVLLADLLGALESSPLVGLGWSRIREAHLHVVQVAVGAGILGVIGYLMVVWAAVIVARTLSGRTSSGAILAAGLMAFVVMGLAQNILWDRYIWIYIGMAVAVASRPREQAERRQQVVTR